jgi:MOSC domain-containing protein YiiM
VTAQGRVVSVNVGLPREVVWKGRAVTTAIFKQPANGPIPLRRLNLDGDRQADLSVHGGPTKAVYAYSAEHYAAWRRELSDDDLPVALAGLPWGSFGENLTVEGLPLESGIAIGDRYRVGSAELVVTQPRLPCYKLGIRFGRDDMVKRFLGSGRTGWYFAVEAEGEVEAGAAVELLDRHPDAVPVSEITRLYAFDHDDAEGLARLDALDALPDDWRPWLAKRLDAL